MSDTTATNAATNAAPSSTTVDVIAASALAVPFVGFLAGIQGAATNLGSTALISASRDLDMTSGTQSLAASIQTLAIAATVVTTGLIADRIGRRKMIMIALAVSCLGQLIVAASPTSALYLLGMAITGVGMGATYGAAFGFLVSIVPKAKAASAMGLFTAFASLSGLVFTFAGGVLCGIDWRYTFLLLPVVTSLALLVTPMVLPKIPPTKGGALDVPGQVLLAVGVTALLYGSSELANSLTSLKTLGPIVAGIALLGGFFLREALAKHHFFPVSIFRSPVFLAALCAGFIYNFGTAVSFLQVTNLWQYITGLNATKVSIWQLPMLLSGIAAGLVTGRLIGKRISNRVAILGGSVLFLIGSVLLSLANTSKDFVAFLPGLVIGGAGVVVAAVPYGSLILREAPAGFVGPVTSARTTVGQIFYTLGFALSMVSIDRLTNTGVISRLKADGVSPTSYGTGLDAIRVYASTSQKPTSTVGQEALQGAAGSYGDAFSVTMIGAGVIATIVGIVAFVLLSNGRDNEPAAAKPVAASVPTPATS